LDVKQFSSEKILKHLDKVYEWLRTGNSFPVTMEIDLSNVCNNKCPKCFGFFGGDEDRKKMISGVKAKEILSEISELGGRAVTFTGGGEPLCNPEAADIIVYAAKEAKLDAALISNGISLTPEIGRKILPHLVWTRISLDAASPEMYKLTHGGSAKQFQQAVENTRELVKIKKELGCNATIGVGYLVGENTKSEIVECAALCKELGVDYVQYRPFLRIHGGCDENYDIPDLMEKFNEAFKLSAPGFDVLYSKHKYDTIDFGGNFRAYGECYGHHFAGVIAANLSMYLCCHMRGIEKYKLGDLTNSTLKEIWNSDQRRAAYEHIDFRDCPPLCRCNTFNEILWNIKKPVNHKNFL
jgi:radical SAM protein with 4Fe4S-binding SPASM domain